MRTKRTGSNSNSNSNAAPLRQRGAAPAPSLPRKNESNPGDEEDNSSISNGTISIERGVAMPKARAGQRYPFKRMAVGDSFEYPGTSQAASQAVNYQNRAEETRGGSRRYAARTMPDKSVRIWRTA